MLIARKTLCSLRLDHRNSRWAPVSQHAHVVLLIYLLQRCADVDICGPGSADFLANTDGPWIRQTHLRMRPFADLKRWVLFAGPNSNRSANVPVLTNLRTDPYLDTSVRYVSKPVWLCGARHCLLDTVSSDPTCGCGRSADMSRHYSCGHGPSADLMLADADYPRTWNLWIRTPLIYCY